jgi:hypothetical protein
MTSKIFFILILLLVFHAINVKADTLKNAQAQTTNAVDLKRETEVLDILKDNLSWSFGKGLSLDKWPSPKDAKNAFSQLVETDIPILIKIIQKHEVSEAEINLAIWELSLFGDKAKIPIMQANDSALLPSEKKKWLELLETIETHKIVHHSESNAINKTIVNTNRETEVVNILKDNLSWSFGKGSSLYKWPTSQDARNAFSQLSDMDIPILIKIVRKNEIGKAEIDLAEWVLSMFDEKAKKSVMKAYDSAVSTDEKNRWTVILELIEANKSK